MEQELIQKVKRLTPQSKSSSQDRLIRFYAKHSRSKLGLSKTRLAHFINLTNNICKRDVFLVLRKIKFNESFDVLASRFSMRASTALYIFKHRVPKLASQLAILIDWHDSDVYKLNNPEGASEHLKSIVDHFVVAGKRKYFISCTPFGLINFLSCGYPIKMANQRMIEQSNFVYELPMNADVMGPRKYQFLTRMLQNESYFSLWESFEQNLIINNCRMKPIDKWIGKPMIVQLKHELRRFKILSDSQFEPKLLPIIDNIVVLCAALCNLRKNWPQFQKSQWDVDQEVDQDHQIEEEDDSFDTNNNEMVDVCT